MPQSRSRCRDCSVTLHDYNMRILNMVRDAVPDPFELLSQCCGAKPIPEPDTISEPPVGRCSKCQENAVFEYVTP